ncbi:MAG TPA: manganese efflux pump [Archangium sp.]|nr:manganese efflux pump [Archangium sp.]
MSAILVLGLILGLDNLQVGAALGMLQVSRRRRWAIALAFGACETVMPLLGMLLGRRLGEFLGPFTELFGAGVLALAGLLIIVMSWHERDASQVAEGGFALLGLPVSLSLDNLLAGVGLGALGHPVLWSALTIGAMSTALCAMGLFFGGWLRQRLPGRAELVGGMGLVVLSVLRLLGSDT